MKTIYIILLLSFFSCKESEPTNTTTQNSKSFIIGTWIPKDTTLFETYVFEDNGKGKQTFLNNWYDITYTIHTPDKNNGNNTIDITFLGRTTQYWIRDNTDKFFRLCLTSNDLECMEYNKK